MPIRALRQSPYAKGIDAQFFTGALFFDPVRKLPQRVLSRTEDEAHREPQRISYSVDFGA